MIANSTKIKPDGAASGNGWRSNPAQPSILRPHSRPSDAGLLALIPSATSVLWLGAIDPDQTRELESRSCRVFVIAVGGPESIEDHRPQLADLSRLDLGRGRFDVVVAFDILGRVGRPEGLLDSIKVSLRNGGRLVATVPNAANQAVLQALTLGLDPYCGNSPLDTGQLRLFTRDTLVRTVEDAGFAIGQLVALEEEAAENQLEAGSTGWLTVAYPLPVPGLEVIQYLFREQAQARDEAEREAQLLRTMLARTYQALDAAHQRSQDLSASEHASHAAMIEAQEALLQRDEEFRATTQAILERLSELEPLCRERDAAHRHALAAEARCRSLELRIEHVLMEIPRRLVRKFRRLARGRGV